MPRIGELLVADGVVSEVAVQSALGFQRHTGEPFRLGTILLDRDLIPEEHCCARSPRSIAATS
jgi:hypothetical protein